MPALVSFHAIISWLALSDARVVEIQTIQPLKTSSPDISERKLLLRAFACIGGPDVMICLSCTAAHLLNRIMHFI